MRAELLTEGPQLEQRCHLVEEPLPLMDVLPKTQKSAWRCDSESHLILFILFCEFYGTREHVSALSFRSAGGIHSFTRDFIVFDFPENHSILHTTFMSL